MGSEQHGLYPRGFSNDQEWSWPLVPAHKLVKLNYGKALRAVDRTEGKVPVYGTNGKCGTHNRHLVKGPGVILGRKGQGPLGVEWCDDDYWVIDTAYYITLESEDIDLRYFYYLTKYIGLNHLKDGTSNPSLSRDTFALLLLPLPPISTQTRIVEILSTIDDKIELNRRMNATLEGMAQALFKSWFVDFDPVIDNALAVGNPIPDELAPRAEVRKKALGERSSSCVSTSKDGAGAPSLPDTTQQDFLDHPTLSDPQSLFPAAFQFTEELGWIPGGWEASTIDDTCEIIGGGTPSTRNPDYWEGGEFPWVTPKDFSALQDKVLLSSSRFLTQAGLDKVSSGLLPKETVLMSSRAPVGYLALTKIETAINQGFIGMICNKHLSPEFVLQWADSRMDDIKRAAGGSTFAEISKKAFRPFEVIVPSHAVVAAYTETVGAIYDKIADGVLASQSLTKLRDTLLPRLISGELRLPEAELLTEDVIHA